MDSVRYYNKTSGPLSMTLLNGQVVLIPGKRWGKIPWGQEGSPALRNYVNKKFLSRDPLAPSEAPVKAEVASEEPDSPEAVVSSSVKSDNGVENSEMPSSAGEKLGATEFTPSGKTRRSTKKR